MMNKNTKSLETLLYKPLLVSSGEGEERLMFIYGTDIEIQQRLSPRGKQEKKVVSIIHLFDVTRTIERQMATTESCVVTNAQKFKENVQLVDADEYMEQLMLANSIVHSEMTFMAGRLQAHGQALMTLRHIAGNSENNKSKGGLVVGNESSALASIFYNTITGDVARLEKEEVEKVGSVIMQVIMNHLSTDLSDDVELKKLKAEIEYKLIDALPAHIKAGDININMESIIDEIKKYQGGSNDLDEINNGE